MEQLLELTELFGVCLILFILIDYFIETYIKNKKK